VQVEVTEGLKRLMSGFVSWHAVLANMAPYTQMNLSLCLLCLKKKKLQTFLYVVQKFAIYVKQVILIALVKHALWFR
jgi:hypothetical protein